MGFQMFTAAGVFFTCGSPSAFFHRWKTSTTRRWRLEDKDRRLALNGLWGELPKLVPQGTQLQQQGTKLQQHRLGWSLEIKEKATENAWQKTTCGNDLKITYVDLCGFLCANFEGDSEYTHVWCLHLHPRI